MSKHFRSWKRTRREASTRLRVLSCCAQLHENSAAFTRYHVALAVQMSSAVVTKAPARGTGATNVRIPHRVALRRNSLHLPTGRSTPFRFSRRSALGSTGWAWSGSRARRRFGGTVGDAQADGAIARRAGAKRLRGARAVGWWWRPHRCRPTSGTAPSHSPQHRVRLHPGSAAPRATLRSGSIGADSSTRTTAS